MSSSALWAHSHVLVATDRILYSQKGSKVGRERDVSTPIFLLINGHNAGVKVSISQENRIHHVCHYLEILALRSILRAYSTSCNIHPPQLALSRPSSSLT